MQFEIQSKTLLSAVIRAGRTVNPKAPFMPATCLKLQPHGDALSVTAVDANSSVEVRVRLLEATPGTDPCCVEYRKLIDLLRKTGDVPLSLSTEPGVLTVASLGGEFRFNTPDAAEFPSHREFGQTTSRFLVSAETLRDGLSGTVFAAADESAVHRHLCGVCIAFENGLLTFAATDTRLIALRRYTVPVADTGDARLIVPEKAVRTLAELLGGGELVEITTDGKAIRFESPTFSLTTALLMGRFPEWSRLIPAESPTVCEFDSAVLAKSLKRMAVFSPPSDCDRMMATIGASGLELRSENPDYGASCSESVPCVNTSGNELSVHFCWKNLDDIISNLRSPKITVSLTSPSSPVIVRGDGSCGGDPLFVFSPLTIK